MLPRSRDGVARPLDRRVSRVEPESPPEGGAGLLQDGTCACACVCVRVRVFVMSLSVLLGGEQKRFRPAALKDQNM